MQGRLFQRVSGVVGVAGLAVMPVAAHAQQSGLRAQVMQIAAHARGHVEVACALPGVTLDCNVNADAHPPMQSVFKLPVAITILHQVEQGRLSLDQKVRFGQADLFVPKTYSPLQDRYPKADVDVPLRELLQLAVHDSDNAAADLLVRTVGGTQVVQAYMDAIGVQGFRLRDTEHVLQPHEALQYRDWWSPKGAVGLLRLLADRSPLTQEHTSRLLGWMQPTPRLMRLQADLPPGTPVAHKSGTSGEEHGVAPATNDIGLIRLPNGRELAIAVFVTNARAPLEVREAVIARIAKAVYDSAVNAR
jgi:beta-lactamase class A